MSIQSEITRLATAKTNMAAAITEKGVDVPSGTKMDGFASLIAAIQAGGGIEGYQIVSGSYTPAEQVTATVVVHTTNSLGLQSKANSAKERSVALVFVVAQNGELQYPTPLLQCYAAEKAVFSSAKSSSVSDSATLGNPIGTKQLGTNKYALKVSIVCNATYPLAAGQTYVWVLLVPSDIAI